MADAYAVLVEEFAARIERCGAIEALHETEARRLAKEAAEAVIGPVLLRELLGQDRLDTTGVARLLRITRQAVHKRVKCHGLLGMPGRGTTWFPAWQFDTTNTAVRAVIPNVLAIWAEADEESRFDPAAVLAWATMGQPELEGETPEEWIRADKDAEPLLASARAAARALAA